MKLKQPNHSPTCGASGVLLLLLVSLAGTAPGQEALQSAIAGDKAFETRSAAQFRPQEDWLRTGPVAYRISLGYGLEWNDNIRYAETGRQADFIHTPQADVNAFWSVSQQSVLSVGVGAGYRKYTDHDEFDRAYISPDSELAWDITVKDLVLTLYDRFEYSQDIVSQGALSGMAEFPRLENTAGLRARWSPSRYVFEAGYGHFLFSSDSSDFNYLNRSAEQFLVRAGYRVAEATQVGVEGSADFTAFDANSRGDGRNLSAGPYVDWQLTEATRLVLRGGAVWSHYDADALSATARVLSSWYLDGEIRNHLTDNFNHALLVSRQVQQGLNRGSDTIELLVVRYSVSWAFHRQGTLTADAFYEHSSEPQFGVEEVYDRYGFRVAGAWQWSARFSTRLAYRYVNKDSNFAGRDYFGNSVTLSAAYRF